MGPIDPITIDPSTSVPGHPSTLQPGKDRLVVSSFVVAKNDRNSPQKKNVEVHRSSFTILSSGFTIF